MIRNVKTIICLTLVLVLCSCASQSNTASKTNVNTRINSKYRKSAKTFKGKLAEVEYTNLRRIEDLVGTKIPSEKVILINYMQRGRNCLLKGLNEKDVLSVINNVVRISSRMSQNKGVIDFFFFSENTFHKDLFTENKSFNLDSGFFYDNIFTLHENCSGFFILKPNGQFVKYYGEDYFTKVKRILANTNSI